MADHELVIITKEFQEKCKFRGVTVTIHSVYFSNYTSGFKNLWFQEFSLLDDPSVKCVPKLTSRTVFEVSLKTDVSLPNEYEISLYYFQTPCKLIHVGTVDMGKISQSSICKFVIPNLELGNVCKLTTTYLFCTKICRKDVPYVFLQKPSTLLPSQITDCSLLFEKDTLTNFKIVIEDRAFWVHKEILAAKSPVFLAMFGSEMKEKKENEMIIEDIGCDVFHEMLRYIYTNAVEELETYAEKLLKAADKYDIPKLKLLCGEELSRSLKVENAIHLLLLADQYHESTLKDRTVKFIQSNLVGILKTEDYKAWRQTAPGCLLDDILEAVANFDKKYPNVSYCT